MKINHNLSTSIIWSLVTGLIISVLALFLSNLLNNLLFLIPMGGILLAGELAHLKKPIENAFMGALIGGLFGLFYYYPSIWQVDSEIFNTIGKILISMSIYLIGAIFYGIIGFFVGKNLNRYRETNGFFLWGRG